MKIFKALASGFGRTLKAWKGIIFIWLGSLLTVSLIALPMKAFFKSAFMGSMITEKLNDGIDLEVFGDIGEGMRDLISSFPGSVLLLILTGIFLSAFLNGGIFNSLRSSPGDFSAATFFRASARNFWSYLVITLIITIILLILASLILILPISLVTASGPSSETAPVLTVLISVICFLLISFVFVLAADYARAWQAAQDKQAGFKALVFGFSRTFGTFFCSYPMILLIFMVQLVFTYLVILFLSRWKPNTGGGVFLLFVISQILFWIKSALKVWRYGSVTSLMEIKNTGNAVASENKLQEIQV